MTPEARELRTADPTGETNLAYFPTWMIYGIIEKDWRYPYEAMERP